MNKRVKDKECQRRWTIAGKFLVPKYLFESGGHSYIKTESGAKFGAELKK